MHDERLIEFQIRGRLTPEKFTELADLLARASLSDMVELVEQTAVSQETEAKEKYNTDYLQLIHLDESDEDVYLVTEDRFSKFFKENETGKNAGQVARAWEGLRNHISGFHVRDLSDLREGQKICDCPLTVVSKTGRIPGCSAMHNWMVGICPDSLLELSGLLQEDPEMFRGLRISPQAAETIGLYIEGLTSKSTEV